MKSCTLFILILFFAGSIEKITARYLLINLEEDEKSATGPSKPAGNEEHYCGGFKAMKCPNGLRCDMEAPILPVSNQKFGILGKLGICTNEKKLTTAVDVKPDNVDKLTTIMDEKPSKVDNSTPIVDVTSEKVDETTSVIDGTPYNVEEKAPTQAPNFLASSPLTCCKEKKIPDFCLGLCTPVSLFTSRSKRITACTKYESEIELCVVMNRAGTGSKVEQVKCMSCGGKGFGQCIGENDMGVEVTCKKHYKSCMTKRYDDGKIGRGCSEQEIKRDGCTFDADQECYCLGDYCNQDQKTNVTLKSPISSGSQSSRFGCRERGRKCSSGTEGLCCSGRCRRGCPLCQLRCI